MTRAAPNDDLLAEVNFSKGTRTKLRRTVVRGKLPVCQDAEVGVADPLAQRRKVRWLEQNVEALESSNLFVEKHGLPLERHRLF